MAGEVEAGAYKDVVLFLATAGVVVPLFRRWRVSPILGFLGAGVLLGPYTPGFVADTTISQQLAEIGIILLMFGVGMHFTSAK